MRHLSPSLISSHSNLQNAPSFLEKAGTQGKHRQAVAPDIAKKRAINSGGRGVGGEGKKERCTVPVSSLASRRILQVDPGSRHRLHAVHGGRTQCTPRKSVNMRYTTRTTFFLPKKGGKSKGETVAQRIRPTCEEHYIRRRRENSHTLHGCPRPRFKLPLPHPAALLPSLRQQRLHHFPERHWLRLLLISLELLGGMPPFVAGTSSPRK